MRGERQFFQRMGVRIMAQFVAERGDKEGAQALDASEGQLPALEEGHGKTSGEMIDAQAMRFSRMGSPRVKVGYRSELPHPVEYLERGAPGQREQGFIEMNVAPDGISG